MKNWAYSLLFICLSLCGTQAQANSRVEVRGAAFFPSNKLFRELYGKTSTSWQLEVSTPLSMCECEQYEVWSNLDWLYRHGHTKECHFKTKVKIETISLGLKKPFEICGYPCLIPYAGLGINLAGTWLRNESPCGDSRDYKCSFGGVVKTGLYYMTQSRVFLDFFVDYVYQPVHFHERHVNVGGFKTGLGIGTFF